MSEHKTEEELRAEHKAQMARFEEARKAGVLTREIANLPDGGRSIFDKETWEKIQNFTEMRTRLPRR